MPLVNPKKTVEKKVAKTASARRKNVIDGDKLRDMIAELAEYVSPMADMLTPKEVAECGDELYSMRDLRYQLNKVVEVFGTREGELRDHIINTLPLSKASGVQGVIAVVTIETKDIPRIKDKAAFQEYVLKSKRLDLIQNRLADNAVKEMWDDKKVIPGLEKFTVKTVSCTKRK